MLSRVAERIYWMARYLERAENTARIINVNSNLLLDLPKKITLGWQPLIEITGSAKTFQRRKRVYSERNIVQFLVSDLKNPSSLLSCLQFARENARTIRDIIPREAWEHINALHLDIKNQLPGGLSQRRRFDFLASVIDGTQQISGLLSGTMLHDNGYFFLRMGRNLERADMTTRIIDVQTMNLLPDESEELVPFENIQWMSVLQSLSGYQSYRQKMQGRVHRSAVLDYLLYEKEFPRSFIYCLKETEHCLAKLPRSSDILSAVSKLEQRVTKINTSKLSKQTMHELIDNWQKQLGDINNMISQTYFIIPRTKVKTRSRAVKSVARATA